MEIEIREIKEIDYFNIVLLWNNELGNSLVNDKNIISHYKRINGNDNYKTFVVLWDDNVIGFISMIQAYAIGFEIGYLHINGFAVKKEFQNKGFGTMLLKYTEKYAIGKGLSSIILNSGFKRTDAHAFYEHYGFDKDSYCFDKIL